MQDLELQEQKIILFLRGDNTFAVVDTTNASNLSTGTLPNARLNAVPNSALANNSITINGSSVALGGSVTVEQDFYHGNG